MYITSSCDKWQYYSIDYIQGYENTASFFTSVVPGEYVLFMHVENVGPFRVRVDSFVNMERPVQYQPHLD